MSNTLQDIEVIPTGGALGAEIKGVTASFIFVTSISPTKTRSVLPGTLGSRFRMCENNRIGALRRSLSFPM